MAFGVWKILIFQDSEQQVDIKKADIELLGEEKFPLTFKNYQRSQRSTLNLFQNRDYLAPSAVDFF
jgi:hypothetical protein